jgi:hypothetical protein
MRSIKCELWTYVRSSFFDVTRDRYLNNFVKHSEQGLYNRG